MLVDRCHCHGAKVCVQISPGLGRQQFTDPFTPPYSASLAKVSGADAVELHAYGGYLLDQFHSKQWNTREDEYGGSLENRMRFTLECVDEMRKNVGPKYPIIVKFTLFHGTEGGRELEEGLEMAKIFEEANIDALHVDVGCYETWHKAIYTVYEKEEHQMDIVEVVKKIVSVPVLGKEKMFDPQKAEKAIIDEKTDYILLGHQMLADPYWDKKVKEGNIIDIVPCIGCNECLLAGFSGKHYYCAVNPLCYAEDTYKLPKSDEIQKSVLVIGGGPGGMSAAITAV